MNLSILKSEIARRNLSVRKASEHIGISHVTLLRILSGEMPNLETLSKLAEWTLPIWRFCWSCWDTTWRRTIRGRKICSPIRI